MGRGSLLQTQLNKDPGSGEGAEKAANVRGWRPGERQGGGCVHSCLALHESLHQRPRRYSLPCGLLTPFSRHASYSWLFHSHGVGPPPATRRVLTRDWASALIAVGQVGRDVQAPLLAHTASRARQVLNTCSAVERWSRRRDTASGPMPRGICARLPAAPTPKQGRQP